jgi:hypothetical protein
VCFTSAIGIAIGLALAEKYFTGHGIAAPFLTREFNRGAVHMSGADIILVAASVGLGVLAMGIWLLATKQSKHDSAAFSGAGLITGAANTPAKRSHR